MAGPSHDPALYRDRDVVPIRRALVSVSDKTDLLGSPKRSPPRASRSSRPARPPRRSATPGYEVTDVARSPASRSRSTGA